MVTAPLLSQKATERVWPLRSHEKQHDGQDRKRKIVSDGQTSGIVNQQTIQDRIGSPVRLDAFPNSTPADEDKKDLKIINRGIRSQQESQPEEVKQFIIVESNDYNGYLQGRDDALMRPQPVHGTQNSFNTIAPVIQQN